MSVSMKTKDWFFPMISSLIIANTFAVRQLPSKPVKLKIIPEIAAGIRRHQPIILNLLGNNNFCVIIQCFHECKVYFTFRQIFITFCKKYLTSYSEEPI